ncbi:MAG: adenosine deaminase [Thermoanaerobaculia bacterium]
MNLLADCHLHFEGCLPVETLERLARSAGHPFADGSVFERRRSEIAGAAGFLSLYAELCRVFRQPEDYALAARDIAAWLTRQGVGYAEIYVSPEIFRRMGLDSAACLAAIHEGFQARPGACDCRILLDAVRQWGPDAADRVLDLHEKRPLPSVVGFGMGGDENALPAASFAGVYARARALGLKTSVHAGEWGGPESVREALDSLRPDRLDHGIAAALEDRLLERLADERTVLCVAPSGNRITGALAPFRQHPLPRLLEAGVRVALSADDPLLFGTSTAGEYDLARRELGLSTDLLRKLAQNSWRAAFCGPAEREAGLKGLSDWHLPEDGKR